MSKSFLTWVRKGSTQLNSNNVVASFLAGKFTIPSFFTEKGRERFLKSIEANGSVANRQEAFTSFVMALNADVDSEIAKKRTQLDNIGMSPELRQQVESKFADYQSFLNGIKSEVEKIIKDEIFKGLKVEEVQDPELVEASAEEDKEKVAA